MTRLSGLSAPFRGIIYDSVLETIGATPLVRLRRLPQEAGCGAAVLAKLEFFNPLSSVKDRAALSMVEAAEAEGRLSSGGLLVEATSGNTGIGLAFVAAVKGYRLVLTMPENMSVERRKLLSFLGAELVLTPADEGMAGAVAKAEALALQRAGVLLRQFANPANPAAHRRWTAEEIWKDTNGNVDVFVAGVGTGGTLQGVGEGLRHYNPSIRRIAVQPESSPVLSTGQAGIHAIQGIGANFVPDNLDLGAVDEVVSVTDEEAFSVARALARQEGLAVGPSSGAAAAAALRIAQRPEMKGKTLVTLFPDGAERYLSTDLFAL